MKTGNLPISYVTVGEKSLARSLAGFAIQPVVLGKLSLPGYFVLDAC